MTTYRFGGNQFTNCSVPLAFEGRYFIVEPGFGPDAVPRVSVLVEHEGRPVFEVLKNEPAKTSRGDVTKTPAGIVTVTDHDTKRFLYKVRPASETSIVFGTLRGEEVEVKITDRSIRIGTNTLINNSFDGMNVGVTVEADGGFAIGGSLPASLRQRPVS